VDGVFPEYDAGWIEENVVGTDRDIVRKARLLDFQTPCPRRGLFRSTGAVRVSPQQWLRPIQLFALSIRCSWGSVNDMKSLVPLSTSRLFNWTVSYF
jgi:hypothetical protein